MSLIHIIRYERVWFWSILVVRKKKQYREILSV